jgi:hypothetical protein
MGTSQPQDVGHKPNQPGKQGTQSPQQPNDRPAPHSGQDKGKDRGQNRPDQMGKKGSGEPSRPA